MYVWKCAFAMVIFRTGTFNAAGESQKNMIWKNNLSSLVRLKVGPVPLMLQSPKRPPHKYDLKNNLQLLGSAESRTGTFNAGAKRPAKIWSENNLQLTWFGWK
jgi:hypothetical protein